ncbi:hypothetical protein [Marinicellulosiphila megalodicopiae]|uniref:hypothetical protein n=1 Tax=Marinicellulosiphila megalodicopiae TaxID=2724896 RepID=UPI003BAF610B
MIKHLKSAVLVSVLSIVSSPLFALDYLYEFSGGVNYWATGEASGQLGGFKLSNGTNGVNYHYSGSRLGLWANAKSGLIIFPNIKMRYQDIAYSGTGEIVSVLNVEIGDIDLSSLLGDVESTIDASYLDVIASFTWPLDLFELDMGLKARIHAVNYSIGEIGGVEQTESTWLPLAFLYVSAEKSFVQDNLSIVGEYSALPYKGVLFETVDAFVRYKLPVEQYFPLDVRVQAGFQSFAFTLASDSDFNLFTQDDIKFGFESVVLGVTAAF